MSRRCYCLLSLFCVLVLASHTLAQNPPDLQTPADVVAVTGTIFSEDGRQRLDNAMVNLCDPSGNLIQQGAAGGGGYFAFRGLRRNEYVLKITADSYQPAEVRVNLQFGSQPATFIYMKRIPSEAAKTANLPSVSRHQLAMPAVAQELLAAGRKKLYHEKNAQAALEDFLHAQEKAPGFYELEYEIGMAYLDLGEQEKARDRFVKAISLSKDKCGEAQVALGTVLVDEGYLEDGEKKIRRGIELNPSFWMGYYQFARLELLRDQLPQAETDAEQARSLAPNAAINYQLLSVIHLREKKYRPLLQDIDMYLELDPDSAAGQRARSARAEVIEEIKKEEARQKVPPENKDPG
jgi:tetratricopeptide (TPR) repeat protein